MKKHKDISNPYALSWYMKKHGAHPHKKHEAEADADFDTAVDAAYTWVAAHGMPDDCTAAARGEYWAQAQIFAQVQPVLHERRW